MDDSRLVSIIVPVYNVQDYIDLCMNTLLKQTYGNIEIILVDDGSQDNSGKKCDLYMENDSRIVVVHKQNGGLSSARNAGLLKAKGEFVLFVDSDDWIDYDYVEKLMSYQQKFDADIVSNYFTREYGREYQPDKRKKIKYKMFYGKKIIKHYLRSATAGGVKHNDISCCTKLYKKSVLEGVKFNENLIFEDVIYNAEVCCKVDKYMLLNYRGYHYYVNRASITKKKAFSEKVFDLKRGADLILTTLNSYDLYCREYVYYASKIHVSILFKLMKTSKVDKSVLDNEIRTVKRNFFTNMLSYISFKQKLILFCFQFVPKSMIIKYVIKRN